MPEAVKYSRWNAVISALSRRDFWRAADRRILAWGPWLLLVFAVFYYGQYYRSGLNLSGEGGTTAVYAMRLNEGWVPFKETFLGYNVMWFYPVAWMFRVLGPDYIALRIYFFGLCWLAAVMGFLIVRRVTGRGWYALGTGLLIAAIPGMLFRNYMGLLPLLNAWALLGAFVFEPKDGRSRWAWFLAAGAALGLAFLIRVEVGNFLLIIYVGLVLLYPVGGKGGFGRRVRIALAGGALGLAVAVAMQWPFYRDAQRRGFAPEFVGQYVEFWRMLPNELRHRVLIPDAAAAPASSGREAISPGAVQRVRNTKPLPENWRQLHEANPRQTRPRKDLRDLFRQPTLKDAVFVLSLYLPVLTAGLILAGSAVALGWAIVSARAAAREAALVCLVTLGCALTLFPQYYFFRPDTPHLSEFMVPFLVAMACAAFYAVRFAGCVHAPVGRAAGLGFSAFCLGVEALYFSHAIQKESAGTIAANHKCGFEFAGENNVRVRLKKGDQKWLQGLHDTIVRYAGPKDWVVAFPYAPTINFMTNRPSYFANLYVDNATAGEDFPRQSIADIRRYQPAVIVIDQRDINATEFSRFRNWAEATQKFIERHYVLVGTFDGNEVYVRPDKVRPRA